MEAWRPPFGSWSDPPSATDGVLHLSYFEEDDRLGRYRQALNHLFWSVLDHPDYELQETYNSLFNGVPVDQACLEQIRCFLFATVCVDRWVEGALSGLFEANRVVPLLRRLRELRARYPKSWQEGAALFAWAESARAELVRMSLQWEDQLGIAPPITSRLSELDAAALVKCPFDDLRRQWSSSTAVTKGFDFRMNGLRYQVKANRPSGKPGSFVTKVAKPKNTEWDVLIWILYDRNYQIQEAWRWTVEAYKATLEALPHLRVKHLRMGEQLFTR